MSSFDFSEEYVDTVDDSVKELAANADSSDICSQCVICYDNTALSVTTGQDIIANTSAQDVMKTDDPFIDKIKECSGIELTSDLFTSDIVGYNVPLFTQPHRNHFSNRQDGKLTNIEALVMHYTAIDLRSTLDLFTADIDDNRVSSTYVITEYEQELNIPGGKAIQIVDDERAAWHAGVSRWQNLTNLNGKSIGIEHVNNGFSSNPDRWYSFDKDQIATSGKLSRAIVDKYGIPPVNVVGHSDIAPSRKIDPGVLFPWGELYTNYGVGAWLDADELTTDNIYAKYAPDEDLPDTVSIVFLSKYLRRYGYNVQITDVVTDEFSDVLKAFKAHFSYNQEPDKYSSAPDMRDMFWIWALNAKYKEYLPEFSDIEVLSVI